MIVPPFLIVPVAASDSGESVNSNNINARSSSSSRSSKGSVDSDFNIDQSTGDIRTNVQLDREQAWQYEFIAVSLTGVNLNVNIVSISL